MKVLRTLVAASQLVLCVAEDCSDSFGSCATKQASLMQFKSLSQKKQSLALESAESVTSKLASFQKFTDEMIAKYGQSPDEAEKPIDQKTLDAVYMVLKYINGMHDLLQLAHDADVIEAGDLAKIYETCISEYMTTSHVQDIVKAKDASESAQEAHEACLLAAAVPCEQKCNLNGPCAVYDSYRKTDQNRFLPGCVTDPQMMDDDQTESAFGDSFISANTDSPKLPIMEACLDKTKRWLDPLYDRYDACHRIGEDCQNNVTQCDYLQKTFQQKRCEYAAESNGHCGEISRCFSRESGTCSTKCDDIKIRAAARAADNETGQRLICLLHNLFGEPTEEPTADSPTVNATFNPRPSAQERVKGLEDCKGQEIVVRDWSIPCDCPETPPSDTNGYTCPTGGVTIPCKQDFLNELKWKTALASNSYPYCDEDSARGRDGVINYEVCDDNACIAVV